jgi:CubicO group peptidase (beta-lactamase class C family)
MQRNAIFRLASMTKPITAVAAMILVEECRLRLDDPADEWLPELGSRKVLRTIDSSLEDTVPATRRITVRDLLTFRSGCGEVCFHATGGHGLLDVGVSADRGLRERSGLSGLESERLPMRQALCAKLPYFLRMGSLAQTVLGSARAGPRQLWGDLP